MFVCVFICMCEYQIFFIHSSWILMLFPYILAIISNAAVNIRVQIPLWDSDFIFFRYIPRSESAWLYGSSIFNFWVTSILFSIVTVPFYIPTNRVPFLHIHASICHFIFFNNRYSNSVHNFLRSSWTVAACWSVGLPLQSTIGQVA